MQLRKPCSHQGCCSLAIIGEQRCEQHKQLGRERKQAKDKERGPACKRGYGRAWQRYRLQYLSKNPLCVVCEREHRIMPAIIVDHIEPHKGDQFLFWDKNNHQALCKRCHDRKTATEDGGFKNKRRENL